VYDQTQRMRKIKLLQQETAAAIFITVTALNMIVLSDFKQSGISISHSCSQSFMFGEFVLFHNSGILLKTSLYLQMSNLSTELILTCSLCGEDIHSLISCLCVAWINIICQCAFCNRIVWPCPSFHRLNKSFM